MREQRRHNAASPDQRNPFERDRDRVLYTSAFHRLAGVTQIVRADEADVFHTRQQHTIKVAQVGRRLAQRCLNEFPELSSRRGLDPEVVEAACLAHDLGHPPFGHVGEAVLHRLVSERGDTDGFEGNAQSFRILTKLSVRFESCHGLDLTRATLNACLKYPWFRETTETASKKAVKWSAYRSERDDFEFARAGFSDSEAQSLEAALMDWADDIAYSVHDLEDFHRCGALPWRLILGDGAADGLVARILKEMGATSDGKRRELTDVVEALRDYLYTVYKPLFEEPYTGAADQRRQLRVLTSSLIGRYINAAEITEEGLDIDPEKVLEVRVLKQITRDYIIENPSLAAQQQGHKRILEDLFEIIFENSRDGPPRFLPIRLRYLWDGAGTSTSRFAADCVASLTESEASALHARLFGLASGSVLDPIVR